MSPTKLRSGFLVRTMLEMKEEAVPLVSCRFQRNASVLRSAAHPKDTGRIVRIEQNNLGKNSRQNGGLGKKHFLIEVIKTVADMV